MPDPTSSSSYPLTNYYFLLKTENLNPLIDAINQITDEITNNQIIIDSLSTTIINENSRILNNEKFKINDPLHYLLEQKYNLSKPIPKSKLELESESIDDENLKEYKENLLNDIKQLKLIQLQKKIKNKEFYKILNQYNDEIINLLLPGLRKLINNLLINQNLLIKLLYDKKNHIVLNQIYNDYLKYVEFIWKIFDNLKILCESMS